MWPYSTNYDQTLQASLFIFHLIFLIFRMENGQFRTRLSTASSILATVAVAVAALVSFLEDQRSIKPSDLLVLYFSATTLTYMPVLRSLWLILDGQIMQAFWTMIFIDSVLIVFVESAQKAETLRPAYKYVTKEQTASLWNRTFFAWVVPFLRVGYSKVILLEDVPNVDKYLQAESASRSLERSWKSTTPGHYRLIWATIKANSLLFLSAVPPRLSLSAFTFCQPFIVSTSISFLLKRSSEVNHAYYGPALVGATVLVYLGIAVSILVPRRPLLAISVETDSCELDVASIILAPDEPPTHEVSGRSHCHNTPAYSRLPKLGDTGCCCGYIDGYRCREDRPVQQVYP